MLLAWLQPVRLIRCALFVALAVTICDWAVNVYVDGLAAPAPNIPSRPGVFRAAVTSVSADQSLDVAPVDYERKLRVERFAAHQRAQQELRNVVLFRDGRGMHSSPAFARIFDWIGSDAGWKQNLLRKWFAERTGVIFDDANQIVGFHRTAYKDVPVIAQGCAVCHVGKVLGQVVPGLGNKNIDPYALASSGQWEIKFGSDTSCAVDPAQLLTAGAARFREHVGDDRLGNLTQGMVSVTTILSWFYEQAQEPLPVDMARAAVKVPALWGYGEKRMVGQFCDGSGDNQVDGWPAMVELVGGQTPETVRSYHHLLLEIETMLGDLLPPAYPLAVDPSLAVRGHVVFQQYCQRCHGRYEKDESLLPRYRPPMKVAIEVVGTDEDRLRNLTPEFFAIAARNPLADMIQFQPNYQPGYFAPRLEGIWARFPYLHNGSVPTIAALLTSPDERPRAFELRDAGEVYRFDSDRLGLTVPAPNSEEARRILRLAQSGKRDIYVVTREGHGNGGHDFGTTLAPDEKRALIEYLKTL